VLEWMRRLSDRHTIDVYSLSTANHDYCDLRPFADQTHVADFQPSPLFQSPLGRLNQFQRFRDLVRLQSLYRKMAAEIDAGGYDVVFANPCIYTFIPILQIYLRTPSLYYLHEHFGNRIQRVFERPYLKMNSARSWLDRVDPLIALYRKRMFSLQRCAVKCTRRLLANSEFTKEQFMSDFQGELPVVHYGVDSDTFRPISGVTRAAHVLSVGEMSPRKGFDFLIESLACLPIERRPTLRLACNSQIPEERAYIEHLAVQRGVQLEVLSNLDSEQLALEYNRAGVVVYSPVLEPFGLVPLEAMACAAPVVGVAEGGVKESVVEGVTGHLTPRDPRLFAEAVGEVLQDPEKARSWGQNGREQILKNWSWERSTVEIEQYLLEAARTE
jgi:glycosyltransferase involved in cell wall biosynthesis